MVWKFVMVVKGSVTAIVLVQSAAAAEATVDGRLGTACSDEIVVGWWWTTGGSLSSCWRILAAWCGLKVTSSWPEAPPAPPFSGELSGTVLLNRATTCVT